MGETRQLHYEYNEESALVVGVRNDGEDHALTSLDMSTLLSR